MFCARSRPTNKGNREQKPITKKLAEFHNQFVLLTMFTLIEKANTENKYCFLLGDFNINLLNYDTHTQTEDFINTLNSYFFEPHIIKPTRITDHTATLIDIFFNSVDFDAISGNLIFDLTDHLSNFLNINDLKTSSKK